MRDNLCMLFIDDGDSITVQLFEDIESVESSFNNLNASVGSVEKRAILLNIDFPQKSISCLSKVFPQFESQDFDMYVLGEGGKNFTDLDALELTEDIS